MSTKTNDLKIEVEMGLNQSVRLRKLFGPTIASDLQIYFDTEVAKRVVKRLTCFPEHD